MSETLTENPTTPHIGHPHGAVAEDLTDLAAGGYFTAAVPEDLGGPGLTLHEVVRRQRTLAYRDPAAAHAATTGLSWIGAAADLHRGGDHRLTWLLDDVVVGRIVTAVHGQATGGPDLTAVAVAGGYTLSGHVEIAPPAGAWDLLGVHATNHGDPQGPAVVHAFVDRKTAGVRTSGAETRLKNVFVPQADVVETVALGHRPSTVTRIYPWALPSLGNIALGIAERALDTATESARTGAASHASPVQHRTAQARLLLENATAQLDHLTAALSHRYVPDDLLATLSAATGSALGTALRVADLAPEIAGTDSVHTRRELGRLRGELGRLRGELDAV